jgi:hypothetical protein
MAHLRYGGVVFPFDHVYLSPPVDGSERTSVVHFRHLSIGSESQLSVTFDENLAKPIEIRLIRPQGAKATELTRFPWKHWIDTCRRHLTSPMGPEAADGLLSAQAAADRQREPIRRPGRRGRDPKYYGWLLARQDELKLLPGGSGQYWETLRSEAGLRLGYADLSIETVKSQVKRARARAERMKP